MKYLVLMAKTKNLDSAASLKFALFLVLKSEQDQVKNINMYNCLDRSSCQQAFPPYE